MTLKSIALSLALSSALVATHAQQSLVQLVNEAQAHWMMGTWEGTTDDGATLTHSFAWDLDRQVVVMRGKAGDMAYMGVTAIDPATGEPTYTGFDNRGAVSKGAWSEEAGDVALTLDSHSPTQGKRKMAVVFGRGSAGTLELRLHGVDDWGYLRYPAGAVVKMKKSTGR